MGVQHDQWLLAWKWYIQGRDIATKGQHSLLTGEIHKAEIDLLDLCLRDEQIHVLIGKWGSSWSPVLQNIWFTDGSQVVTKGVTAWTAAAFRPEDGVVLREQGKSSSAQHAELIAVVLAETLSTGKATYG